MRLSACLVLVVLTGAAAAGAAAPATSLVVEMTEFRFRPAVIRLAVGRPAAIRFVNRGQLAHQFATDALRRVPVTVTDSSSYVDAPGLEVLRLQPGTEATLRFTPRVSGRARFACTIEGHAEAGMTGVIDIR